MRAGFALAMTIFFIGSLVFSADIPLGVPKDMAQAIKPISVEEEMKIGRAAAANVIAQFELSENEALTEYVNLVGLTVAQFATKQDVPYRFSVLNSNILNAFAAPGGYIFVTTGLLAQLKDEAQLACVLGHEITHVSQRHVIKEIQKSRIANAAIPSYAKASAEKAQWMKQVTDLAIQMIWKGLSREDELESDRLGIEIASKAGYDAAVFLEVLEMLKSRAQTPQGFEHELKFMLSTHPKPDDRLKAAEDIVKFIPVGGMRDQGRFKQSIQAPQESPKK